MARQALVPFTLPADPVNPLEAATKQYVDAHAGGGGSAGGPGGIWAWGVAGSNTALTANTPTQLPFPSAGFWASSKSDGTNNDFVRNADGSLTLVAAGFYYITVWFKSSVSLTGTVNLQIVNDSSGSLAYNQNIRGEETDVRATSSVVAAPVTGGQDFAAGTKIAAFANCTTATNFGVYSFTIMKAATVGPAGGPVGPTEVTFQADGGGNTTLTTMAAAEDYLATSVRHATKVDLTLYTQCRLVVRRMATASAAGAILVLKYSTTDPANVFSAAAWTTSGAQVALSATNTTLDSGWINMPAGMKVDNVNIVVTQSGGDGAASPVIGAVRAYFRGATTGAITNLNDLGDVTIATPANGQVVTYESASGQWKNQAPVGMDQATADGRYVNITGDTLTGDLTGTNFIGSSLVGKLDAALLIVRSGTGYIDFSNSPVTGLPTPSGSTDAANKGYVDGRTGVFTSGAAGVVPASGGGTTNYLRADGTWTAPAGGGGGGSKLTDLAALTGAGAASGDLMEVVDISDTTMAATGTNKKITLGELTNYLTGGGILTQTAADTRYVNVSGDTMTGDINMAAGTKINGPAGAALVITGVSGGWIDFNFSTLANLNVPVNDTDVATKAYVDGTNSGRINAQTGTTYAPLLTDVGDFVTLSNAAAITVTMPSDATQAFLIGSEVTFLWLGAGQPSFAQGSGATLRYTPGLKMRAQYSVVTAKKIAANTWALIGDLSA